MLRLFFTLVIFFSCHVFADDKSWSNVISVVHQVREILEKGDKAEPWRFERVKNEIEVLNRSPFEVIQFLNKAYRSGLLHLDQFQKDIDFIKNLIVADGPKKTVTKKVRELQFDVIARQISEIPQQVIETPEEPDGEVAAVDEELMAAFQPPGTPKPVTLEAKARAHILALQKSIENVLRAQEAFTKSGKKVERAIWWVDSFVKTMALAAGIYWGAEYLKIKDMKPREMIAWSGAVWAGHVALYYFLWDQLQLMKSFKKFFHPSLYRQVVNSWASLIRLNPQISARTAAAAAQDKPTSYVTEMDEFADAAFEGLVRDDSHYATKHLFELALGYLENNQPLMAKRALEEIDHRAPHAELSSLAGAVNDVFETKRRLEWKTFFRQAGWTVLKVGALAIGYLGIDFGVRSLTPDWFHHWRTIPGAIMGAIGARKLYALIWKPMEREKIEKHSHKDTQKLLEKFRMLMKVDPSGALVSRIAQNPGTHATQQIFTDTAVQALSEVPSGEVAMNMFRMVRAKMALNNSGRQGIEFLVKKTFEQQIHCLDELVRASTELGNALKIEEPPAVASEPLAPVPVEVAPAEPLTPTPVEAPPAVEQVIEAPKVP